MNLAAESKLATRKRYVTRNMSGKNKISISIYFIYVHRYYSVYIIVLESPSRRGIMSRIESRTSEYGGDQNSFHQHSHERSNEDNMRWPSNESRLDNSDFGDTSSVGDFQDQNLPVNYLYLLNYYLW